MLSIPSTNVSWPTSPPSQAVAPTQPVAPVSGSQSGNNSPQAGLGYGQESHGLRADAPASGEAATKDPSKADAPAAPLLPRQKSEQGNGQKSTESSEETQVQEERDRLAKEQQDQLERSAALREQLREVLSNVWQASAAVVDRALHTGDAANDPTAEVAAAVESAVASSGVRGVDGAAAVQAVELEAAALLGDGTVPEAVETVEELPAIALGSGKVESYDEKGHGNPAPVPPGVLVNQLA